MQSLPSRRRLLLFCVLLPTAVAATNQSAFEVLPYLLGQGFWLHAWMAFSTAALSWCTGRHLWPAWLRWLVFCWCLTLLVTLTFAACIAGRVERHLGYVLVSALLSVTVVWAILANASWQWRLPAALVAVTAVTVFSGSFDNARRSRDWNLLMIVTAMVVAILCGFLRFRGFVLFAKVEEANKSKAVALGRHQFGLIHILLWSTALAPILLVSRGLDFLIFRRLGAPDLLPFVSLALSIAIVNLMAIWTVLGEGHIAIRLAAVFAIPYLLAIGLSQYLQYVASTYRVVRIGGDGRTYPDWLRTWFDSLVWIVSDSNGSWVSWLWLDAALLAALLLFLRGSGYRLVRGVSTPT